MKIKRLAHGEPAPANGDCIAIDAARGGSFNLSGTVLCGDEVVSLISSTLVFDTREAAEEQGVAGPMPKA